MVVESEAVGWDVSMVGVSRARVVRIAGGVGRCMTGVLAVQRTFRASRGVWRQRAWTVRVTVGAGRSQSISPWRTHG